MLKRFPLLAALLLLPVSVHAAPLFPFDAISPDTLPKGEMHLRVGVGYVTGERLIFQREERDRETAQLPALHLGYGVSDNVELLFCYPMLLVKQDGQGTDYGSGDLKIGGLFNLFGEASLRPETALHFAAKLPNADDEKGFGTDETDFFFGLALGKRFGELRTTANLEMGILGNPGVDGPDQDDVLVYALNALYPVTDTVRVGMEWSGQALSKWANDRTRFLAGTIWALNGITLDFGIGTGWGNNSPDVLVRAGITAPFIVESRQAGRRLTPGR